MNSLPVDLLLLSIATPLVAALAISLGAPLRLAKGVAAVAFAVPALIALFLWSRFGSETLHHTYAFYQVYDTGLQAIGIHLSLGLNG